MELIKDRKNIICCFTILIEFIFIEFPNVFLVGPIGIFGDSAFMIKLINTYGKIARIVSIDSNMLLEIFMQRIGNCTGPCAQLARIYADNWSVVLIACIPIWTITYINKKMKDADSITELLKILLISTCYVLAVVVALSVVPFICMFKLSILYNGGSAMEIFKYIGIWILPSIPMLIELEMLTAFTIKEPLGQILSYVLLVAPSLPPEVSHYPFYKLVVRFNGQSEAFYYEMRSEIVANRIFIMVFTVLVFIVFHFILKRKRRNEEINQNRVL